MPDEKFDEKDREKREEKTTEEKSWDEKWRRDPIGTIAWAAIFIWAGLVLLANNIGFLDRWIDRTADVPGWQFVTGFAGAWSFILIGAGVIILLEILVRTLVPAYRRPVTGSLILAVILIGIGLGDLWDWGLVWPLILIVLGLSVLMRGLLRQR